jgi:hypothetical protein
MTRWISLFLIKASKSRGGVWSNDDYSVRDRATRSSAASGFTRKHRKRGNGSGRLRRVKSHHRFTIADIQRHANWRWRILRRDGQHGCIQKRPPEGGLFNVVKQLTSHGISSLEDQRYG